MSLGSSPHTDAATKLDCRKPAQHWLERPRVRDLTLYFWALLQRICSYLLEHSLCESYCAATWKRHPLNGRECKRSCFGQPRPIPLNMISTRTLTGTQIRRHAKRSIKKRPCGACAAPEPCYRTWQLPCVPPPRQCRRLWAGRNLNRKHDVVPDCRLYNRVPSPRNWPWRATCCEWTLSSHLGTRNQTWLEG